MDDNLHKRKVLALGILEDRARLLQSLTADVLNISLEEAQFSEPERMKFVGACLRMAQKRGWLERTSFSVKSKRNHSNLHSVWYSTVFGLYDDGALIPRAFIEDEYKKWKSKGIEIPDKLAKFWASQKELGNVLFK